MVHLKTRGECPDAKEKSRGGTPRDCVMTEAQIDRHVLCAIDGEATPKLDSMISCATADTVTLPLAEWQWTTHPWSQQKSNPAGLLRNS